MIQVHWDIWRVSHLDPIVLHEFLKYEPCEIDVTSMRLGDRVIYPA